MSARGSKNNKVISKITKETSKALIIGSLLMTGCYQTVVEIRNTEPVGQQQIEQKKESTLGGLAKVFKAIGDSTVGQISGTITALAENAKEQLKEKEITKRLLKDKSIILKTNKKFTVKIQTPENSLELQTND